METQQNSEQLISRLLDEQKAPTNKERLVANDSAQVIISTSRVMDIRYRIYFLIILVFIFLFGNYFLLPAWNTFQATNTQLENINLEVAGFATKKAGLDADKQLVDKMEQSQQSIVTCLNERQGCKEIDAAIKDNFGFARAYIQLNNLTDPKMVINEKVLLANINEYLLKKDSTRRNGDITRIAIGEPAQFKDNLWSVPLNLSIVFDSKDSLLSFLSNVETKILPDPQYRVLYKIDNVSYDISNYTTQQSVDVTLDAYYYTN